MQEENNTISLNEIRKIRLRPIASSTEYSLESIDRNYTPEDDESNFIIGEYQRKANLWNDQSQSQLIESILLNYPIPLIIAFTDLELEDKIEIVDGLQRLTAIKKFLNNELCLSNLDELTELNGLYFKDLDTGIQIFLKRQSIKFVIYDASDNQHKLLPENIFGRLNKNQLPLSDQELRQSYNNEFTKKVKENSEINMNNLAK